MEMVMERQLQGVRGPVAGALKAAAMVLLLGLMVAAAGRSLAPPAMERPDDRTAAEAAVTDRAYRHVASYQADAELTHDEGRTF